MSIYSVKGKGWRYDFTHEGTRVTGAGFRTKAEARRAEAARKEERLKPAPVPETTPTDTGFLDLVNQRLDHIQAYRSERHYRETAYVARRWVRRWGKLRCSQITLEQVERFILERARVSGWTANKEIRYLRSLFNFGLKRGLVTHNPTIGIDFLPVDKRLRYVPSVEDIDRVIAIADPDTQDYLWTIRETMARVSEVNRLRWEDVSLPERYVVLFTRKKRGGHLTPRKVPMTNRLFALLSARHKGRNPDQPWVFWHRYWSRSSGTWTEGPYKDRKNLMAGLCRKAGVRYFRYHALRHCGASLMERSNVPIGSIQRILGHESRITTEIY